MARSVERDPAAPHTRHDRLDCSPSCTAGAALLIIDGTRKSVRLWHLRGGTLNFNQIHGLLSSVTQCMLTTTSRAPSGRVCGAAGLCAWSSSIRSGAA